MKFRQFFNQQNTFLISSLALILSIFLIGKYSYTNVDNNRNEVQCEKLSTDNNYFIISVLLEGIGDKATTMVEIKQMRSDIAALDPNARVNWALTNEFVFYESNQAQLKLVKQYVDEYNDEISIGYGFPNNREDEESWKIMMKQWTNMYSRNLFNGDYETVDIKYKPKSVSTYLINPLQAKYVRDTMDIDVFMGQTATQYNVDQMSAVGSPIMPYFSNEVNSLVPAQEYNTDNSMLFLNTMTLDPIGSKYIEEVSRWTIHPADPLMDGKPQIQTIANYINNQYRESNTVNYLSLLIEPNWIYRNKSLKIAWDNMVSYYKEMNLFNIVGLDQFNKIYRCGLTNETYNPTFTIKLAGTGYSILNYKSEADITYLWTETKRERIILSKKSDSNFWKIIDFTDYTGEIPIMPFTKNGEDVSFISKREYKIKQDGKLSVEDIARINSHLKEIGFWEKIIVD
jgi:hypothetical protein